MKKLASITLVLMLAFSLNVLNAQSGEAPEWTIDNNHSNISFTVNHYFNPIPGTFHDFSGTIKFDPENPSGSHFDVVIKVASVDTNVDRRDGHLRTADFFDAETYPDMHFRSTDIRALGDNKYMAHGTMTIKDVTKEVAVPFELTGAGPDMRDPEVTRAGLLGMITLNRNDFGVGVGDFASTAVISDEVDITISLQVYM